MPKSIWKQKSPAELSIISTGDSMSCASAATLYPFRLGITTATILDKFN